MPTTPRGIEYPDSSGHTRLWEHLQTLADSTDAAVDEALPAWSPYMPTLGWTLGNGTIEGRFQELGTTIHYLVELTFGSSSSASSTLSLGLPFPVATFRAHMPMGQALLEDASTAARRWWSARLSGSQNVGIGAPDGSLVSSSSPWTPAAGDRYLVSGTYERG